MKKLKTIDLGDVLMLSGLGIVTTGIWWIHPASALIFLGVACTALGYLVSKS